MKILWVYTDIGLLMLYCSLIYALSDQPVLSTPMLFPHQDKIIHAIAYAVMAWLAWRTILHTDRSVLFCAVLSMAFCSLYGISDEWHQSFIAYRQADVWDWLADTTGATLAVILLATFQRKKQRKTNASR